MLIDVHLSHMAEELEGGDFDKGDHRLVKDVVRRLRELAEQVREARRNARRDKFLVFLDDEPSEAISLPGDEVGCFMGDSTVDYDSGNLCVRLPCGRWLAIRTSEWLYLKIVDKPGHWNQKDDIGKGGA